MAAFPCSRLPRYSSSPVLNSPAPCADHARGWGVDRPRRHPRYARQAVALFAPLGRIGPARPLLLWSRSRSPAAASRLLCHSGTAALLRATLLRARPLLARRRARPAPLFRARTPAAALLGRTGTRPLLRPDALFGRTWTTAAPPPDRAAAPRPGDLDAARPHSDPGAARPARVAPRVRLPHREAGHGAARFGCLPGPGVLRPLRAARDAAAGSRLARRRAVRDRSRGLAVLVFRRAVRAPRRVDVPRRGAAALRASQVVCAPRPRSACRAVAAVARCSAHPVAAVAGQCPEFRGAAVAASCRAHPVGPAVHAAFRPVLRVGVPAQPCRARHSADPAVAPGGRQPADSRRAGPSRRV